MALHAPAIAADETGKAGKDRFPFQSAALRAMDASECRTRALEAENGKDCAAALTAWERVIDRSVSTEEQRLEARVHIGGLRAKVPRNTDPASAKAWKTLVVIFRKLEFSWTDGNGKRVEVQKTISEENEKTIRGSLDAFCKHVFHYSSGMLRIDPEIKVIDEPLTQLHGRDQGPFAPAPHLMKAFIDPLVKGKSYDTIFVYVKYNGDKGPAVPAPYVAATFERCGDFGGIGFIMVPWHTNYPFPGETDGEMELHEWLHQVDSMFRDVLHYPDAIVPSSDCGRSEGDNRPGGDTEYIRKKSETTWINLYRHIMEDHITRQMWLEATMRLPAGEPAPGDVCKPPK